MAAEEFFMYLTIGLVILIPVTVRLHRYLTRERTARMLREQLGQDTTRSTPDERQS